MSSRASLTDLLSSGITAQSLLWAAAPDAVFESALTDWAGLSRPQAAALVVAETAGIENGEITEHFVAEGREGVMISGEIEGEPIDQILLAAFNHHGQLTEIKSFVNCMHPFTMLRDRIRGTMPGLPAEAWRVIKLEPDTGEFLPKPSHSYSPSLTFHSPVLRKSVSPEPVSSRVLGHATSIYGARQWSDIGLNRDTERMAYFTGDIKGQPVTIAAVLRFDAGELAGIKACARPWPASLAVYSRVKARIGEELGAEYFWTAQPDYESYL
ncbi:hypothetical protein [Streptomyces sp. NPDC056672]|uniref:hypothetical protein n=1 Tax=Streptomyces sp. NPDC056672 TaxID=3345906 RepID=UPI00369A56F9